MKTFARLLGFAILVVSVHAQVLEVKPDRNAIVKDGPYGNAPQIAVLPPGTRVTQIGEAPRYYAIQTTDNVTGWSYRGNFQVVADVPPGPIPLTPETLLARKDVLKIIVIDVEVGDATLIICPEENGTRDILLVDCGESNDGGRIRNELVRQGLQLTDRPITRFYATHYDSDHIGSVGDVAPLCQVAYDHGSNKEKAYYRNAMADNNADRRTIELSYLETFSGGVNVDCVAVNTKTDANPNASPSSDENSNSVALEISYGSFNYFAGGDLTLEAESTLTSMVRNCDVYHVNHHGSSATSSSLPFVSALDPEVSVASNGTKHGHPTEIVANRLITQVQSKFFQTNINPDDRAHHPSAEFVADDTYHSDKDDENAEGAQGNITIVVDLRAGQYYVVMPGLPLAQATFPIEP